MNNQIYTEIDSLTEKIHHNTATLHDYKRYELLLLNAGLSREYIFSYLNKAGFNTWEEFIRAREIKQQLIEENQKSMVIGGLVGIGLGLLLARLSSD